MSEVQTRAPSAPSRNDSPRGVLDIESFEKSWSIANQLAQSELLPKSYRSKPENVILALDIASRLKVSFVQVVQNLVLSKDGPGWLAQFLIAAVNTCGRFTGLRFEAEALDERKVSSWRYDVAPDGSWSKNKTDVSICDKRVRAYSFDTSTGDRVNGAWVSLAMAHTAGWYTRPDSQWPLMEDQMLMYRAGAFFQRAHAPELSVGFLSMDEVADMAPTGRGAASIPLAETVRAALPSPSPVVTTGGEAPAAAVSGTGAGGTARKPRGSRAAISAEPTTGTTTNAAASAATPQADVVAAETAAGDPPASDGAPVGPLQPDGAASVDAAAASANSAELSAPTTITVPEGCGPLEAAFVVAQTPAELEKALSLFKANETPERVEVEQALYAYVEPILAALADRQDAGPLLTVLHSVIHEIVEDRRVRGQLNALYALHYRRLFPA